MRVKTSYTGYLKILFNLMRRVILLILTMLCCIPFVQAQDIITTKDGKDIQSKILEVNANEVTIVR